MKQSLKLFIEDKHHTALVPMVRFPNIMLLLLAACGGGGSASRIDGDTSDVQDGDNGQDEPNDNDGGGSSEPPADNTQNTVKTKNAETVAENDDEFVFDFSKSPEVANANRSSVTYSLGSGNKQFFTISEDGRLSLNKSFDADLLDSTPSYSVTVVALTESDDAVLSSVHLLELIITDLNDEDPVFDAVINPGSVDENGPFQQSFKATADVSGDIVTYSLSGDDENDFSLTVDATGHNDSSIDVYGQRAVVNLGDGNDEGKVVGLDALIFTGTGNDNITVDGSSHAVHSGTGDDVITNSIGGLDTFIYRYNKAGDRAIDDYDTLNNFELTDGTIILVDGDGNIGSFEELLADDDVQFEVRITSEGLKITKFDIRFYNKPAITVNLHENKEDDTRPNLSDVTILNQSTKSISLVEFQKLFGGDDLLPVITMDDLPSNFAFL